ncbi:hypothetical protein ScPMuIL_013251 [Solemya velum]
MATLDNFLDRVTTQDTKKRLQCHTDLVPFLSDPHSTLECVEFEEFIGGISNWISSSNYKVSINGLEVLCLMVDRMGEEFRPHVTTVLPPVIDRLGDLKDPVRDQAQQLLLKLMLPASNPQYVFDRLMGAFGHKLWHVREGVLMCLQNTLNTYGARCLQLSKVVPHIIKLLEDQNQKVRETAMNTLAEIYRHVGEKVRSDLRKKNISQARLNQIFEKFDKVKKAGDMLPTADVGPSSRSYEDEPDFARPLSTKVPQAKRVQSAGSVSSSTSQHKSHMPSRPQSTSNGTSSGGVDDELFLKAFEDVPTVQMFSSRDLQDWITRIKDTLNDSNIDWEKRQDAVKNIRGLLIAGAADHDEFNQHLRTLEPSLMISIKDLRSQIVRETCITVAYLSQQLGHKFEHCAEMLLPSLIALIPNSAKVMSTSGIVCIRFIIQHTHGTRLVPAIIGMLVSKSSSIRRFCCEIMNILLHTWPTQFLERHIALLQDSIKKGINDADSEARAFARKAFWGFSDHFKDQADALLNTLDASKQKLLQGEMSGSSSTNSINSMENLKISKHRLRATSQDRTTFDSSTVGRIGKKSYPRISSARSDTGGDLDSDPHIDQADDLETFSTNSPGGIIRSSSAIDLLGGGSKSTTKVRRPLTSTLLATTRLTPGSTHSLPRQKSSTSSSHSNYSERSRHRPKMASSQSQPNSRSASPTPRGSYITHSTSRTEPMTPGRTRKSVLPRSQGTSRDSSPTRSTGGYGRERRASGSKISSTSKATASRILRHGSDVEDALADALRQSGRRRFEYDSDDAASETSSVCSERSYSSYGRTSEDMSDVIDMLMSGAYADRKEGLIYLQRYFSHNRHLTRVELKKVTEIFTRMFHDPHSKVLSLFLDTLIDLIAVHRHDLNDWLYILITRLLNKTSVEMLGSVHAKIQRALDAVRDNFPCYLQLSILTKFIIDQTQSPSLKVKLSLLSFMHGLVSIMEPSDFTNSSDIRLAISRIITWTTDPKSLDIRKSSQTLLVALFNVNPPEFSMMLSALPKTFQDGATKIIHNHLMTTNDSVLAPKNITSPPQNRSRPPSRGHHDDADTENMNPEDIYNSIKKTSADIQSLSFNSKLDNYGEVKKKLEYTSQDSGIQDLRNESPDAGEGYRTMQHSLPHQDESSLNRYNRAGLPETELDLEDGFYTGIVDSSKIGRILKELSNHNTRHKERNTAMLWLIKYTREGKMIELWDEHFKPILLMLLETLGDNQSSIRSAALRTLREILRKEPSRFREYSELTILRILEAHKDQDRSVVRSAEECADTLATSIPPEQSIHIVKQIVQNSDCPVNLAAVKMETKIIEFIKKSKLEVMLPQVIPGLLKCYDDVDSGVRKATVFCLVAIYQVVGEAIWAHLSDLGYSKKKLLNVYIKRAEAQREGASGIVSPQSSDTT